MGMTSPISIRESLAVKHLLTIHDRGADPRDIQSAIAWIGATPENQEAFQRARAFWECCERSMAAVVEAETLRTAKRPARRRQGRFAAWFVAAACVVAVGVAIAPRLQLDLFGRSTAASEVYRTGKGEIRSLRLSDGSRLTLGGGSAVSFQETSQRRTVVLADGEAIFDVAKDARRPFVVFSGAGSTTALGTRFSVRTSPDGIKVTLARGLVKVAAGDRQDSAVVLTPGSEVTYSSGGLRDVVKVDAEAAMSWPEGKLYFVREPLDSVVYSLNRYSDKPIIIENPDIAKIPITGIANLDDILHWLRGVASVTGIEFVENEDAIRLSVPKGTRTVNRANRALSRGAPQGT
jgi:transmembrane sensor